MKYTKMFAIAGAALSLFVILDNSPGSPMHNAIPMFRILGGAILAIVGGAIGAVIGLIIDAITKKR